MPHDDVMGPPAVVPSTEGAGGSEGAEAVCGNGRAPRILLRSFEGPLDLLLHLIRINEISITDIPIVEICRQYDEYLSLMKDLDLEIAGEYLVMAATLTHIKSKTLLPAPPAAPGEEPEDPRADLVRQLLEYQRIKAAAEVLRDQDEKAAAAFIRGHAGEDPLGAYRDESLLDVSLFELLGAFKRLVESLDDKEPLHVRRDEISVAVKIAWILDQLERSSPLLFQDLLSSLDTRSERIATFLAILELIRLRLVRAHQRRAQGEILIRLNDETSDAAAGDGGSDGH